MKKTAIFLLMLLVLSLAACKSTETTTNDTSATNDTSPTTEASFDRYIANKNSGKLHYYTCDSLPAEHNRVYFSSEAEANAAGYRK